MFALLAAATTGTINFGETYSVKGDPNQIKSATSACYGQPHNTGETCPGFAPVLDNVGGSMVFSASEQQAFDFLLSSLIYFFCYVFFAWAFSSACLVTEKVLLFAGLEPHRPGLNQLSI